MKVPKAKQLVCLIAVSIIGALFFNSSAIAAKTVRVHSQEIVGTVMNQTVEMMLKLAEEKSGGSLKFSHYPAMQLFKDSAVTEGLPDGLVEIGAGMNLGPWGGLLKEVNYYCIPTLWENYDHYSRFIMDTENGGGFGQILYKVAKERLGLIYLGPEPLAPVSFLFKEFPEDLNDFSGLKIRTAATKGISITITEKGGKPAFISASEAYPALQRGIVDGVSSILSGYYSRKWYEPVKKLLIVEGLFPYYFGTFVNKEWWDTLTKEQKRAIADAHTEAAQWAESAQAKNESVLLEKLKAEGVVVKEITGADAETWKSKPRAAIKKELFDENPEVDKETAAKIWKMMESTKGLPTSTDEVKVEIPVKMYEVWNKWFCEQEGI